MNTTLKKLATGGIVAVALAGTAIVASAPAEAQYYHRGYGYGYGAPLAAGLLGGLAAGAIVGAATAPYYAGPPAYAYGPGPGCYWVRGPVYDQWGRFAGYRPTQVCN